MTPTYTTQRLELVAKVLTSPASASVILY